MAGASPVSGTVARLRCITLHAAVACSNPRIETVDDTPGIEAKLRYLQSTLTPAGIGEPVHRIETHMSWVQMGGERMLKLKNAVRAMVLNKSGALWNGRASPIGHPGRVRFG